MQQRRLPVVSAPMNGISMDDKKKTDARKPYQQPEARRFPLRPDEAVLGNCKSNSAGGPSAGSTSCHAVGFCRTAGS